MWVTHLLSQPTTGGNTTRRRGALVRAVSVAVVATGNNVTGLTDGSKTYTVYMLPSPSVPSWEFRAGVVLR